MDQRFTEVTHVLQNYFDGLYFSDVELLKTVFHPKAHYVCATESPLVHLGLADYFPIVAARVSPASRNDARADEIVSMTFAGPSTAFACVKCVIGPKHFTDFLTLIHHEGQWRIISKVFHFDLH